MENADKTQTTDKLYALLVRKTQESLRDKLGAARRRFEDALGISGTSIDVYIKVNDELVPIRSITFFDALNDTVFNDQIDRELQREVNNFLGSFEYLRQQISYLEANGLSNEE